MAGSRNLGLLFVGDSAHREFAAFTAVLRSGVTDYREVPSVADAQQWLQQSDGQPDVIVIAQRCNGEFPPEAVHPLLRLAPLARVVWCLSCWSAGAGRSAPRPFGQVCWAQPHLAGRLLHDLHLLEEAKLPSLGLPPTAGVEEQLQQLLATSLLDARTGMRRIPSGRIHRQEPPSEAGHPSALENASPSKTARELTSSSPPPRLESVAIFSSDSEFAGLLAEACGLLARKVYVGSRAQLHCLPADAVVYDLTPWLPDRGAELAEFRKHQPTLPLLAITEFPRPETYEALLRCGAAAVLTKPLFLPDLLRELQGTLGRVICSDTVKPG